MEPSGCKCADAAIGEPAPLVFHSVRCGSARHLAKDGASCVVSSSGRHWKDVLVDLGGLWVQPEISGRICIGTVSKSYVSPHCQLTSSADRRWFVLHQDELLLEVDVCFGDDEATNGLLGIRLTTTERATAWYGSCVGAHVEVFAAPTNFFINGLFTSAVDGVCVEMGVRFEPKDRHEHPGVCDRDDELTQSGQCPLICAPSPSSFPRFCRTSHVFVVSHYHVRAVVVRWSTANPQYLERVEILSSSQYRRMQAANQHGRCQAIVNDNEEMVVLSEGEDIVAVDVMFTTPEGGREQFVVAVRLTTTRSGAGQWLGESLPDPPGHVVAHGARLRGEKPTKMTGFRGIYSANRDRIVEIIPVYHQAL